MKTRGFAVVLAIMLAAVATGAVYLYVKGVKQDNKTAAGQVQVLVSKANIPAGTALDPLIAQNQFELKSFSGDELVQGAVTSVDQLRGHSTSAAIIAGEQITLARLSGTTARTGGILGIKDGYEAVTLSVDAPHGGGGFVQIGDHITVYAQGSGGNNAQDAVVTLIPDVRVLSVFATNGSSGTAGNGVQATSATLQMTLELTPQDAEKLILASGSGGGSVWMALLPPGQAGSNTAPLTIGKVFPGAGA